MMDLRQKFKQKNISITGKGTVDTPYVVSAGASIHKIIVDNNNLNAITTIASTIVIMSDDDGNMDRFTLPTNAQARTSNVYYP
jgi:streptogramin lyase